MAFKRCARHFCCRVSEMSMVVAEKNQGDLLNVGRRGPMDSAPCGMTSMVIRRGGKSSARFRLWGPHKNRAPLFVPRSTALVNASTVSWSEEEGRQRCPPQEKGIFCLLFVAVWTKSMASGGTRPAGLECGVCQQNIREVIVASDQEYLGLLDDPLDEIVVRGTFFPKFSGLIKGRTHGSPDFCLDRRQG